MQSPHHHQLQQSSECKKRLSFPAQLHHLLEMVERQGKDDIISWLPCGKAFKVHKREEFVEQIMKEYFRQTVYRSFLRQLNLWGFKRMTSNRRRAGGELYLGAYEHKCFQRDRPELCLTMKRKAITETESLDQDSMGGDDSSTTTDKSPPLHSRKYPRTDSNTVATAASIPFDKLSGNWSTIYQPLEQNPHPLGQSTKATRTHFDTTTMPPSNLSMEAIFDPTRSRGYIGGHPSNRGGAGMSSAAASAAGSYGFGDYPYRQKSAEQAGVGNGKSGGSNADSKPSYATNDVSMPSISANDKMAPKTSSSSPSLSSSSRRTDGSAMETNMPSSRPNMVQNRILEPRSMGEMVLDNANPLQDVVNDDDLMDTLRDSLL